jgi:hypothetical protein
MDGIARSVDEPVVAIGLPGIEISQARKTRSLWMIAAAQLMDGVTTGLGPHFIAYLTGIATRQGSRLRL